MKMKKWISGILLSMVLVLGMMIGLSSTAYAIDYQIWVGGTQVTSENADNIDGNNKASYKDDTKTLTLNGFTYEGEGAGAASDSGNKAIIYATGDLNIILTDANEIINTNDASIQRAVYAGGALTISGSGTLDAKGYNGIRAGGQLTISGGTVNVTGTGTGGIAIYSYKKVSITGCTITAISGKGHGIAGAGIEIQGGVVKTDAGKNGLQSPGDGNSIKIGGGKVDAFGGSIGINAGSNDLSITEGCEVVAAGEKNAIVASVCNDIAGTGWTNKEGTEGKADIDISSEGQTFDYKKVQFPAASNPISYATVSGNNQIWQKQGTSGAIFTIKGSPDDTGTFDKFLSLTIDGTKEVPSTNYDKKSGSLILTLKPDYLNSLSTGNHTMNFNFEDGAAAATLTIQAAPAPAPTEAPTEEPAPELPQTGDSTNLVLWLLLTVLGLGTVIFMLRRKVNR